MTEGTESLFGRRIPPIPDGFSDGAAWDAIHWRFGNGGVLDQAVIGWQRDNQERVKAAAKVMGET